jgi:glutamate 5-kinase
MNYIDKSDRIVIKVGSSHLVDSNKTIFHESWLNSLVDDVIELQKKGKKVIIVTSGAIALGYSKLGMAPNKAKLKDKQTASCCGQVELMNHYKKSFSRYGVDVAQILLTIEDVENRRHVLSARNVIDQLLKLGIVPIINENDVIATAEIRFGDNDRLAARVTQVTNSDLLVLLSNVDGLFMEDPSFGQKSDFIAEIYEISPDIEKMAGDSPTGSGGMSAKIAAAKIALNSGCNSVITYGKHNNPIKKLIEGYNSTWVLPNISTNQKYKKA